MRITILPLQVAEFFAHVTKKSKMNRDLHDVNCVQIVSEPTETMIPIPQAASIAFPNPRLEHIVHENVQQNDAEIVQMWSEAIKPTQQLYEYGHQRKKQQYNAMLPRILRR